MDHFPTGGLIGRVIRLRRRIRQMRIPIHAANAGYFIMLAVFPMLVLILSLLRYTNLDAVDLMTLLEGLLPDLLLPAAEKWVFSTYAHASTAMVSFSAVSALWSASRGVYGLLTGLNAIYSVEEDRGYLYTRSISVVYTFLLLLVLILTLVLNVFGEAVLDMIPNAEGVIWDILAELIDLRVLLMLFLQTVLFTAVFVVLPNRKNRISDSFPGAVLAALGWTVFSGLFSVYVEHFANYSTIYGSMYALALGMLWLYFCLSILFYGGALNQILSETRKT